jgi:uncharacterized protein (DUF2062 family)
MNWVVVLAAILFATLVLSAMAPAIKHDPFTIVAVFMAGVFVGMLLENANSEDDRRCRKRR